MKTVIRPIFLWGVMSFSLLAAPQRMLRKDAFLGIHFDFHANEECKEVGKRTTPEMVNMIIDKVAPDYIQIDCKGHPGYSSYPTKVGNQVPGYVGDPLRVWRDATAKRGVALFMHYSGVIDGRAVQLHPEWEVLKKDGSHYHRSRTTSVFSSYVDDLMIPQLRELADVYNVDGVWVDGDCWALQLDYGKTATERFIREFTAETIPDNEQHPLWQQWREFNREGFRRYMRHYVNELKKSHPELQVISNWSFSGHMPEQVSAKVAGLSGDFKPDNSVNSARFQGRCLEDQGLPWDLMAWSFSRKYRYQKTALRLKQEAAAVLMLGGGFQAYFKQDRDGAIKNPEDMDVMADVAEFCRKYQGFCHKSIAIPQIALLYSTTGHYHSAPALFQPVHNDSVFQKTLRNLLEGGQAVQILSEHHLKGRMKEWPLIVVPDWEYLDPAFRNELVAYQKNGGALLLVGKSATLFKKELSADGNIGSIPKPDENLLTQTKKLFPNPIVKISGAKHLDLSPRMLNDKLWIHLVNTAGPHADIDATKGGIHSIPPIGPFSVSIKLPQKPAAVIRQPDGTKLDFIWKNGRAEVNISKLELYSIIEIQ